MSNTVDFSQFEDKSIKIFNGGEAGYVENVKVSIQNNESKQTGDNKPDFNVIYTDSTGATLRGQGVWELTGSETPDAVKKTVQAVGRYWRACMGETPFPQNMSVRQIYQAIANSGRTFGVFVAYGTTEAPSKYLGLRKYDFIQPSGSTPLTAKSTDNMVRLVADSEVVTETSSQDLPF